MKDTKNDNNAKAAGFVSAIVVTGALIATVSSNVAKVILILAQLSIAIGLGATLKKK